MNVLTSTVVGISRLGLVRRPRLWVDICGEDNSACLEEKNVLPSVAAYKIRTRAYILFTVAAHRLTDHHRAAKNHLAARNKASERRT